MPQVSIIIPTYNSVTTIISALDSVKNLIFQDWECLVVDGASKDGTIEIVQSYCDKDKRFRYISEKDRGIYDAFNKGWKMAKGTWIHYLGDDDKLTPDGMGRLLMAPDIDKYEIVSGHCYIEKVDGTIKANYSLGFSGCHQGKITRRKTLEEFGGFDEKYSIMADADLMIRLERAGVRILNIDTFVAYFAMTGMSQDMRGIIRRGKEWYLIYNNNGVKFPLSKSIKYMVLSFISITYRNLRGFFMYSKKK